jgi:hypothetical protein
MSTLKSSSDHLTINADGAAKDLKFQLNGVQKADLSSAGLTVVGDIVASGIVKQTASGVASIDFSSVMTSAYDVYELVISGLRPATDGTTLHLRVESVSSFKSGASDYRYSSDAVRDNASATARASTGAAFIELAGGTFGNLVGEVGSFTIRIHNPADTSIISRITWIGGYTRSDGASVGVTGQGTYYAGTTAITGVQILAASGNITSGVFKLKGLEK